METIDPAKAARVWQRVHATPAEPIREQGLLELIAQEGADAAIYLHLQRHFQGRENAMLRKMFEQEQAHAACLKGIYTLLTGKRPASVPQPPKQADPETLLRQCYGREMRCLAQYESRSADPEYGQVFARLAEQERDHCRMVLELLGKIKK